MLLRDQKIQIDTKIKVPAQFVFQDQCFNEIFEQNQSQCPNIPQVYILDSLLTALMSVKQQQFPWNMKVSKDKNNIFFD